MPSKEQILKLLANEAASLHRNKIAEKLGENTYRTFQTQLDRFEKQGLVEGTPDHEYSVTEAGMKELAGGSLLPPEELDEETLGTTEFAKFVSFAKKVGISPPELISVTVDHIWEGGDFRDLTWVAKGLNEMGISQDKRERLFNRWRSYLHQPIPSEALPYLQKGKPVTGAETMEAGKRDYILDENDKPVYVGVGLGDLDKADAMDLARIRGGRGGVHTSAQTPGSMADEVVKMFSAFKEVMGDKAQGKSYMVRQGEEGLQVEEVDPGRPMILNNPQGDNKQKATYFVNQDGEVQEAQPGQPIIIKQPAPLPAPSGSVQYLIDKATGQVTQVEPGHPIIIQSAPPQSQYPYTPIEMKDKDGNPMVLDLSTFIRLEEHKDKQRRDQESHETKQEIAKSFKDLIGKATSALGHMAEEK